MDALINHSALLRVLREMKKKNQESFEIFIDDEPWNELLDSIVHNILYVCFPFDAAHRFAESFRHLSMDRTSRMNRFNDIYKKAEIEFLKNPDWSMEDALNLEKAVKRKQAKSLVSLKRHEVDQFLTRIINDVENKNLGNAPVIEDEKFDVEGVTIYGNCQELEAHGVARRVQQGSFAWQIIFACCRPLLLGTEGELGSADIDELLLKWRVTKKSPKSRRDLHHEIDEINQKFRSKGIRILRVDKVKNRVVLGVVSQSNPRRRGKTGVKGG